MCARGAPQRRAVPAASQQRCCGGDRAVLILFDILVFGRRSRRHHMFGRRAVMKTCPTCGARAFDDAEVCYGCLHRYGAGEETVLRSDPDEIAGEARRADPPPIAVPCATMGAMGSEARVATARPECVRPEAIRSGAGATSMHPSADSVVQSSDGAFVGRFAGGSSVESRSGSAQEAMGPRVEPAVPCRQAPSANQHYQPAGPPRNAEGWSVRFELPGYSPVLEPDELEGGFIVRFQPEVSGDRSDRRRVRSGHGTHVRDAPAEERVAVAAPVRA